MNVETVGHELGEALIHLQDLVADFRAGKTQSDDEPALAVDLGHILDHISRAWNCRNMFSEQRSKLFQEEFERFSNTVPNFYGGRVPGESALC